MVLRFNQVEFSLVRVVVVGDVLIRDRDFGRYLFVHHLFQRDGAPDVTFEIRQRNLLLLQTLGKLFFGGGRLDLVIFSVNLFVGRQQAEFLGATHHDFVLDELMQNVQSKRRGLFTGRLLLS